MNQATVELIISRRSEKFVQHMFAVKNIPMNLHNTVLLMDSLNAAPSVYAEQCSFSPKAQGSSYTISFMGAVGDPRFEDAEAVAQHILRVCDRVYSQLKARQ